MYLSILTIGKDHKFPLFQTVKGGGPALGHLLLPFGDTGLQAQPAALAHAVGRHFDNFEEPLIVPGGIGVVGLAEELVGQVGQYGPAGPLPVHHIVLDLIL